MIRRLQDRNASRLEGENRVKRRVSGGNAGIPNSAFPVDKCIMMTLFLLATIFNVFSNTEIHFMNPRSIPAKQVSKIEQYQLLPKSEAAREAGQTGHIDPTCVDRLLENKKAIIADASLKEFPTAFRILLHPPKTDKYITKKIKRQGSYESDMEDFISLALPLNASNVEDCKMPNTGRSGRPFSVDIGANVGFHSLHMARRGASVISFEPAPDTAELFKCSAELLGNDRIGESGTNVENSNTLLGSIKVIQGGASDVDSQGKMSRHPDSPGMTTFATNSTFPMEELKNEGASKAGMISLFRSEDILIAQGVPEGRSECLRLLKVDTEGYELRALKGLNLTRFPFQYLTFEFFPEMLEASGAEPVDLIFLVRNAGYECDCDKYSGRTRDEIYAWSKRIQSHVNVFCRLPEKNNMKLKQ